MLQLHSVACMCCMEMYIYNICDEAGRGQDSEGGCESWKQSTIGSDNRFGDVWMC